MNLANTTWTVLSQAIPYGTQAHGRRVSPNAFRVQDESAYPMLQALVPYNDDYLRALYVEEILQLLLRSPQRQRILDADPINAYEAAQLVFPDPGEDYAFQLEPTPMRIYTSADEAIMLANGVGKVSTTCVVDPVLSKLTHSFGEVDFAVTGGLSSHIVLIPGLTIRLQSDFATALPYKFTYVYTVGIKVDWVELMKRIERVDAIWLDPSLKKIWEQDPLWTNRLAAFATATVELFRRARTPTT